MGITSYYQYSINNAMKTLREIIKENHELSVGLTNKVGDRLTVIKRNSSRNTPTEHEIRREVEAECNHPSSEHHKYGPWKVIGSTWHS